MRCPKFGKLRVRALPAKQIAAQLLLELPDGAGQRRLGDVALLRSAGEIQRARYRKEITHLVHFHESRPTPSTAAASAIELPAPRFAPDARGGAANRSAHDARGSRQHKTSAGKVSLIAI